MDFIGHILSDYWQLFIEPNLIVWGVCIIIALYATAEAGLAGLWLELFEAEGFGLNRLVGLVAFLVTVALAPLIASAIILFCVVACICLVFETVLSLGGLAR